MTLFPEWQAAHMPQVIYPQRIRSMWNMYGKLPDHTCGQCKHLYAKRMGGVYFKCDLNKDTQGPGTDWRKRWPACGKFELPVTDQSHDKRGIP